MASNAIIGAPYQQVFSTGDSYRYNGEMSPEQALQEQALNRKQQIANLLIQRGLQQPQGQMAGRFYVAPSPVQHLAQLGQLAAGVFGNMNVDDSRKALSDQSKQDVAAALANFRTQTGPQTQSFVEQFGPGEPVAKSLMEVDPYIQQVNANAQPSKQWDQQTIIDQGKNGAGTVEVPAEMNAALEIQRERQQRGPGFYREGPRPTTDITAAASPEQRQQAIIDLLANQHPHVRALGAMLQQRDERTAEKAENRAFMAQEKALDRDVRREGIASNEGIRIEQMKSNLTMKEMQIAQMNQAGQDTRALQSQLAQDKADLQREMQQREITSKENIAKQHDETLKGIAELKAGATADKPMSPTALRLQQEEIDAIGYAAGVNADLAAIEQQIDSGKLKLGLAENAMSTGKNYLGLGDENSRNFSSFKATLETQRNNSLRLNRGVQTEGDAQRAWNELFENLNDPGVVKQRLQEIQRINDRAIKIRKANVDTIRQEYQKEPFDFSPYEQQPASVGQGVAPTGGGWAIKPLP